MHQKATIQDDYVHVVDCDGTSYVLKNQPGILKRLDMENEFEYIDSYIAQSQEDISFYYEEVMKGKRNLTTVTTVGVGSAATIAALGSVNMSSPIAYYAIIGLGVGLGMVCCGSAVGSFAYSNWTLDDYKKMRKAATVSLVLNKYKEHQNREFDKDVSSLQFIDGKYIFDTSYWRGVKLQADLGLAPLNHGWYDPGFLGTRYLRKNYGITKLEISNHINEVLVNKKSKTKCKI